MCPMAAAISSSMPRISLTATLTNEFNPWVLVLKECNRWTDDGITRNIRYHWEGGSEGGMVASHNTFMATMNFNSTSCTKRPGIRKGAWTVEEDALLRRCVEKYGAKEWRNIPHKAGLNRCRKSCRLRWLNYLSPDINRGSFGEDEADLIVRLHKLLGNRWSLIAGRLPGRTANDVKNYWNSHLSKKIDVRDHKERSKLDDKVFKPRPQTIPRTWIWSRDHPSSAGEIQQKESEMQEVPSSSRNHKTWVDAQIIGVPNVENIITKEMQTVDRVIQDSADKKDGESLTGVGGWEDLLQDIDIWGDLGTI